MSYVRPIRLDELTNWFTSNGLSEEVAVPLAQKLYDEMDEILVESKTAQ